MTPFLLIAGADMRGSLIVAAVTLVGGIYLVRRLTRMRREAPLPDCKLPSEKPSNPEIEQRRLFRDAIFLSLAALLAGPLLWTAFFLVVNYTESIIGAHTSTEFERLDTYFYVLTAVASISFLVAPLIFLAKYTASDEER